MLILNRYKAKAWGKDEIQPISGGSNNKWGGLGMTLVDSLDTLYIMGLMDEFNEAKEWVQKELDFEKVSIVSLFETNIRILGGLLAAYSLSKDVIFMNKAIDIGDRFLKAFTDKWPSVYFSYFY